MLCYSMHFTSFPLALLPLRPYSSFPTSAILYSPIGAFYIISNRSLANSLASLSLAADHAAPASRPAGRQGHSVATIPTAPNSSGPIGPVMTGVRQWPDSNPWPFMVQPQSGGYQERPSLMEIFSQYPAGLERLLAVSYWRYVGPIDTTPSPECVGPGPTGWYTCGEDVQCPKCNPHLFR